MKKTSIFALMATLVSLVASCEKELPSAVEPEKDGVIHFTAAFDTPTKTALGDGNVVEWIAGDAISVFDGTNNVSATTEDSGTKAEFTASLSASGPWYALYPYDAKASVSGSKITTTLPDAQTGVADTFDDDLNIAVALSDANSLVFKNVLGLIKFKLTSDDIKSISFEGNGHEAVGGEVEIDYNGGEPTWTSVAAKRSIVLTPSGSTFAPGTYFFAVLPQTFSQGVTFTFKRSDGSYDFVVSNKSLALGRSNIKNVGEIENKIVDDSDPIVFADADVKAGLVAHFDANGDGEISYAEAAAITYKNAEDIIGATGDKLTDLWGSDLSVINTFDELRFFTGFWRTGTAYRLPPLFKGCKNLTSVQLPSQITELGNFLFWQCTSLDSVDLPDGLLKVYGNVFSYSGISEVRIPQTVTATTTSAFENCTNLKIVVLSDQDANGLPKFTGTTNIEEINIPATVTSITESKFSGYSSLKKVTFSSASQLTSIENSAFYQCTSLTDINLPDGLLSIGNTAFRGCTSLTYIYLPASLTSIGNHTFRDCTALTKVDFPDSGSSLSTIGVAAFRECTALTSFYAPADNVISSIGESAFRGNTKMSLRSVSLSNLTSLGAAAFYDCEKLRSTLNINNTALTTIPDNSFRNCKSLTSVRVSPNLATVGSYAFYNCSSMTAWGIAGTSNKIAVPATVTSIGEYAFSHCKKLNTASNSFPEGLKSIGFRSFRTCVLFKNVVLPASLTSIGAAAFESYNGQMNLGTITIKAATPPDIVEGTISSVSTYDLFYGTETANIPTIYVPAESVDAYKAATGWSLYADKITAIP